MVNPVVYAVGTGSFLAGGKSIGTWSKPFCFVKCRNWDAGSCAFTPFVTPYGVLISVLTGNIPKNEIRLCTKSRNRRLVNGVLISLQILSEICHIFKWSISYLYVMILACILVTRHHIFRFFVFTSRPTSLRASDRASVFFIMVFVLSSSRFGARDSIVGWGIMQQTGKSLVRFPMRLLNFQLT
jgi:hypothetical protein